ncbi:MAG: hypothetical protein EPN45_19360 [Rhizobiaceae bacterium]|nr:MAG: hypothetical protein EPN45_19360 [Rhizobiaceae bacterium]
MMKTPKALLRSLIRFLDVKFRLSSRAREADVYRRVLGLSPEVAYEGGIYVGPDDTKSEFSTGIPLPNVDQKAPYLVAEPLGEVSGLRTFWAEYDRASDAWIGIVNRRRRESDLWMSAYEHRAAFSRVAERVMMRRSGL